MSVYMDDKELSAYILTNLLLLLLLQERPVLSVIIYAFLQSSVVLYLCLRSAASLIRLLRAEDQNLFIQRVLLLLLSNKIDLLINHPENIKQQKVFSLGRQQIAF